MANSQIHNWCLHLSWLGPIYLVLPSRLADHTVILTPLTTKDAKKHFLPWTESHQAAFESIKSLVLSAECLTTVDHKNLGANIIFITCDGSDWCASAVFTFGPTWESACPIAFDSMQLKGPEKNYPAHEKELLLIYVPLKNDVQIYWVCTYMWTQITELWKTLILRKISHTDKYVGRNSYPSMTWWSPIFPVRIIL